ncbi:MAG: metallophosphoesterase [Clostridia bacterium]|nr:metallophosphoesterase [Clostridia bacterium]
MMTTMQSLPPVLLPAATFALAVCGAVHARYHPGKKAFVFTGVFAALFAAAVAWCNTKLAGASLALGPGAFATLAKLATTMLVAAVLCGAYLIKLRGRKFLPDWTNRVLLVELFAGVSSFLLARLSLTGAARTAFTTYAACELGGLVALWAVYWAVAFRKGEFFVYDTFLPAVCGTAAIAMVCDFTLRRSLAGVPMNAWDAVLACIVVVLLAVLVCGKAYLRSDVYTLTEEINRVPRVKETNVPIRCRAEDGVYELTMTRDDFRILQLTDIHIGASVFSKQKDILAIRTIVNAVKAADPDLVIVTGDLAYPVGHSSGTYNNKTAIEQFAALMRNLNVPWAFAYGNHDNEPVAVYSEQTISEAFVAIAKAAPGNLLYPDKQPGCYGRNNQVLEVYNAEGTLNRALFVLDSNSYTGEGSIVYDRIRDDQVAWYEAEVKRLNAAAGKSVPHMLFFHIPQEGFIEADRLLKQGSDEVKVFFGTANDPMAGGGVSGAKEPSGLFDKMQELGSAQGVFVGHDHMNDISLEYKGIRFTFGLSTDFVAYPPIAHIYPKMQPLFDRMVRGGVCITLGADGAFDIAQVPVKPESIA